MTATLIFGVLSSGFAADGIADSAKLEIAQILAMKDTFTAAELKMSSNLIFASRQARGVDIGIMARLLDNRVIDAGTVRVRIATQAADKALKALAANGGKAEAGMAAGGPVSASVPLAALHLLAADPSVVSISEPELGRHNIGVLTSQGVISHGAKSVVAGGIDGTGVKVGVLSDSASATRVAALIASGDLGANTTVLSGQAGSGEDEGAAMMEIVQDMAPGAQLYFATANPTSAQFAANITALGAAGCPIICDDYTYFNEGVFQDGPIAQAVNAFVAGGGTYFSSAANSGNLTNGTSGTWEGDFLDGGAVSGPVASHPETGHFHNFGTVGSPQLYDTLTASTTFIDIKWSDPLGGSTNDYDLFILNSSVTAVTAVSVTRQTGTQDPYESCYLSGGFTVGSQIVVVKYSGSARALHLDTERGQTSINTSGATFGHNAGIDTITVAATFWNSAKTGTKPFNGTNNPTETFSSDGPRTIFFSANGTAITPGNFIFATNGGKTLAKPDITAADGVACKTPRFFPFFGTSAAAPHAAGIAALMKQAKPSITNAQIRTILSATAMNNGAARDGGAGVLNAPAAVQAAKNLP